MLTYHIIRFIPSADLYESRCLVFATRYRRSSETERRKLRRLCLPGLLETPQNPWQNWNSKDPLSRRKRRPESASGPRTAPTSLRNLNNLVERTSSGTVSHPVVSACASLQVDTARLIVKQDTTKKTLSDVKAKISGSSLNTSSNIWSLS